MTNIKANAIRASIENTADFLAGGTDTIGTDISVTVSKSGNRADAAATYVTKAKELGGSVAYQVAAGVMLHKADVITTRSEAMNVVTESGVFSDKLASATMSIAFAAFVLVAHGNATQFNAWAKQPSNNDQAKLGQAANWKGRKLTKTELKKAIDDAGKVVSATPKAGRSDAGQANINAGKAKAGDRASVASADTALQANRVAALMATLSQVENIARELSGSLGNSTLSHDLARKEAARAVDAILSHMADIAVGDA